jgi:hypothetical protein
MTSFPNRLFLLALLLVFLAAGLAACGSGTSTSPSGNAAQGGGGKAAAVKQRGEGSASAPGKARARHAGAKPDSPREPRFTPRHHHDSGGGAGQYETKGGDNSVQEFGAESSDTEFAAAAQVLHEYLDARVARAWGAACDRLAPAITEELVQHLPTQAGGKEPSCATILAGLTDALPSAVLREAADADAGALRVEGDRAFLLFDGAHGHFFMPMAHQGGHWKVAAIAASPLP